MICKGLFASARYSLLLLQRYRGLGANIFLPLLYLYKVGRFGAKPSTALNICKFYFLVSGKYRNDIVIQKKIIQFASLYL